MKKPGWLAMVKWEWWLPLFFVLAGFSMPILILLAVAFCMFLGQAMEAF